MLDLAASCALVGLAAAITRLCGAELWRTLVTALAIAALIGLVALLRQRIAKGQAMLQALQESERRFRDYSETASDWYWETNPDHRFVTRLAQEQAFGDDVVNPLGKRRWELAADVGDEPEKWRQHHHTLDRREPFHDFVYRFIRYDGVERFVSVSGKPVFDAGGAFLGYRGSGRDVTQAMQSARAELAAKRAAEAAERDAAAARARLAAAIEMMPEGFVLCDPDDRLVICNSLFRSLYPRSGHRLVPGMRFEDILRLGAGGGEFAAAVGRVDAWIAERMALHNEPEAEFLQHTADGRWIRVQERQLADGSSVGLRVDITELKQREAAFRLSEERFRDFAETSSDWFWEQDAELRFTDLNDVSGRLPAAAAARLGKRRWEVAGALLSDEEWAPHKADLAARRPFRDFRFWRVGDDGKTRCFSISGKPVFDGAGNFTGYRGIGSDVTAQVHAEQAHRLSEERFRDFAQTSSDWFWEQDAELRFTHFSDVSNTPRRFAELIGKTRHEAIERGVTPEQWAVHQQDLAARRAFRDFRYQRVNPDGEVRHISISGMPLFAEDGAFRGYRGTGRDVTAEVRAAAALRQAKEEAEAASRTKSQFLANMSHELRTPLNAILGFSEVIRDMVMGPVDARYREYASDIHRAGQHLLSLIGDVLDLSKIEVGRLELHEEQVNLAEVFDSCRRLVAERAREQGVALELMASADLPPVCADRLRLKQILLNLLSNAVKFTPPGGRVVLAAKLDAAGDLVLSVADSGIGMRPDDIAVALEPFGQVDGALNRRYEGTGLGLPLAKTLAEKHGGRLEIDSMPDRGTVVCVTLPAERVQRAAA